jgi:Na+/H+-dicarboxylate symporter
VGIVSRNPLRDAVKLNMLPIIFASILFGVALAKLPSEKSKPVSDVLDSVGSAMVVLVGFAMRFAPFAIPALIFDVTALSGWGIFEQLSWFVIVTIPGYLLHQFEVFAIFVRIF